MKGETKERQEKENLGMAGTMPRLGTVNQSYLRPTYLLGV
jgi:hypothetical protein